jgi:hypothetical protein
LEDIKERWDMGYKNDPEDEWQDPLGDWLEAADVGETFRNQEDSVTFTRVD